MKHKGKKQNRQNKRGKKAPSNKSLAKKIKHIEHDLIETKYWDEQNVQTALSTVSASNVNCLNNFAEGDTQTSRNGLKVEITGMQFKYSVVNNLSLPGPSVVRIMLIVDKAPNGGGIPTTAGTFYGVNGILDNSVINDIRVMPRSYEGRYRYKVLYDKIHVMNPLGGSQYSITNNLSTTATMSEASPLSLEHVKWHWVPLRRKVVYQDNTNNVTSLLANSLILVSLSDQTANGPTVLAGTRLFFKDA